MPYRFSSYTPPSLALWWTKSQFPHTTDSLRKHPSMGRPRIGRSTNPSPAGFVCHPLAVHLTQHTFMTVCKSRLPMQVSKEIASLLNASGNMEMTPFPGCQLKSIPTVAEEVYCSCRMPQSGKEKMAQCNQCLRWYHQKCEDIPKQVFSKSKNRTPFFLL